MRALFGQQARFVFQGAIKKAAAVSRGGFLCLRRAAPQTKQPPLLAAEFEDHRDEEISVFGRPGSDLLSRVLRRTTIGAEEFYGRVRDGIGYRLLAETTRPAKDGMKQAMARMGNSE